MTLSDLWPCFVMGLVGGVLVSVLWEWWKERQ